MRRRQSQDDWQDETSSRSGSEGTILSRVQDAIHLKMFEAVEWLAGLSSASKGLLLFLVIALIAVAVHFGLLPSRGIHYNPLLHW